MNEEGGSMIEFQKDMAYVNKKIEEYLKNDEPLLEELYNSINYTLFPGGKRIRPLFCFMVGELFDVPKEKMTSLACAVEMIHTASLIMDDLPHMDNAEKRRGKPANHLIYGQDVSALATIGLLTEAYEVILNDANLPSDVRIKVVSKLAKAVGIHGMVGGQFVDLKFSNESMEYSTLDYIHNHKTASLFVAAGFTAASIADASPVEIKAIETYARNLGFAFQILDDLLDSEGTTDDLGKPTKIDKGSFAILHGVDKSKEIIEECTATAIEAVEIFKGKNEKFIWLSKILLSRKT